LKSNPCDKGREPRTYCHRGSKEGVILLCRKHCEGFQRRSIRTGRDKRPKKSKGHPITKMEATSHSKCEECSERHVPNPGLGQEGKMVVTRLLSMRDLRFGLVFLKAPIHDELMSMHQNEKQPVESSVKFWLGNK
jgi:hypothetical protein